MAYTGSSKRSHDAASVSHDNKTLRPEKHIPNRKRARRSPNPDHPSSEASIGSISVDSALRSTPPPLADADNASMKNNHFRGHDTSESSSSSSSDDESNSSEDGDASDDDVVVTIGGPRKPAMRSLPQSSGADNLQARLSAFLPQLAAANAELETLQKSGGLVGRTFEDVDEDAEGGYIEMDLGLGVLEEKQEEESSSDEEEEEDEEGEDGMIFLEGTEDAARSGIEKCGKQDVMSRLMGQSSTKQTAGIQEIGGD